jgi:hypothetical protein
VLGCHLPNWSGKIKLFPAKESLISAGMSLTKLSLVGKNSIIPGQGEFDKCWDVTYQTFPGREKLNYSRPRRV